MTWVYWSWNWLTLALLTKYRATRRSEKLGTKVYRPCCIVGGGFVVVCCELFGDGDSEWVMAIDDSNWEVFICSALGHSGVRFISHFSYGPPLELARLQASEASAFSPGH